MKPKRARQPRAAVVVLPQWNAQPESHVEACRIFNFIGMSALRLTLPYHEQRRPPELQRADHLVSTNVGRTIQSMRQAVLDTRAAVRWLKNQGYERIGILGTSVGSCIAFLAFAHEPDINAGTFNHVSGYVADVAWRGLSTRHLREGFANHLTLDELREYWTPISPVPFHQSLAATGPASNAIHCRALRPDVSARSHTRNDRRSEAPQFAARCGLAFMRALHNGVHALESHRRLEDCHVHAEAFVRFRDVFTDYRGRTQLVKGKPWTKLLGVVAIC